MNVRYVMVQVLLNQHVTVMEILKAVTMFVTLV